MKRTITGIALVATLVFTVTAWSQESEMEHGKKGMGKMGMGKMEMEESTQMKGCSLHRIHLGCTPYCSVRRLSTTPTC